MLAAGPTGSNDLAANGAHCKVGAKRRAVAMMAATVLVAAASACSGGSALGSKAADTLFAADIAKSITVTSPAFSEGDSLPDRFTCEGTNISPSLRWEQVPAGTAELAIVADDPDAAGGTHVHWIVAVIAPSVTGVAEDATPDGAKLTRQSEDRSRWEGPCPPEGKDAHTYRFSVYALKEASKLGTDSKVDDALDAIRARATAKGVLTATFQR